MKNLLFCIMGLFFCAMAVAQTDTSSLKANKNIRLIEKNLLQGLASENPGLCISAAYRLGDLKSTVAVIPLLRLLHTSDNYKIKTAVVWALCNIGDPRGTFAVKQEVRFNNCCKTQVMCAWYYEHMVHSGTFIIQETGDQLIAHKLE